MTGAERQEAVRLLRDGIERLTNLAGSITDKQARWQARPGAWSVLDIIEHVTLVERAMFARMLKAFESPASAESLERTRGRDEKLLRAVRNRTVKVQAPDPFVPSGQFGGLALTLEACSETRLKSIEFLAATEMDLRAYTYPHFILKDMDAYQWLVFLAAHLERHLTQMEEILADPRFPSTENVRRTLPANPAEARD